MAAQKPLVIINGQVQQLPVGDTLAAAASEVDVISMTSAATLVKGSPVYISAVNTINKASAAASGTKRVLGLTAEAINSAASGLVQTDGILACTTDEWDVVCGTLGGLTAGTIYYLSETAGELTSTAPSASGNYIAQVGIALSATEMEIDTDRGGVLLA